MHTIMSRVGFEPTIPTLDLAKTLNALDRGATMIGLFPFRINFEIVNLVDSR
jgi:hypothetical protein